MKNQGENEREREKILKVITRYTQKMKLWEAMDVLINLIVVITSQYIHTSNHYPLHFKLTQCSMSIVS